LTGSLFLTVPIVYASTKVVHHKKEETKANRNPFSLFSKRQIFKIQIQSLIRIERELVENATEEMCLYIYA